MYEIGLCEIQQHVIKIIYLFFSCFLEKSEGTERKGRIGGVSRKLCRIYQTTSKGL